MTKVTWYTRMHTHTDSYTHTQTHTDIHTHTHTHTYTHCSEMSVVTIPNEAPGEVLESR